MGISIKESPHTFFSSFLCRVSCCVDLLDSEEPHTGKSKPTWVEPFARATQYPTDEERYFDYFFVRRVACLIALRNHVANVNRAKAQGRNTVKGAHSFVRMTPNHCKHKTAPNMTPLPLPGSKITYNPFRHQHCDNESRNGSSSKQHNRSRGRSQPCFKLFCYFCASRVSNPSVAFVPAVFQTLLA